MKDGVLQEFYCRKSGGGCGGYIVVEINLNLNGTVEVICPKCNHAHQRCIKGGEIIEQGRHSNKPTERLRPVLSAWSEKPRAKAHEKTNDSGDAVVLKEKRSFIVERWFELFGVSP